MNKLENAYFRRPHREIARVNGTWYSRTWAYTAYPDTWMQVTYNVVEEETALQISNDSDFFPEFKLIPLPEDKLAELMAIRLDGKL